MTTEPGWVTESRWRSSIRGCAPAHTEEEGAPCGVARLGRGDRAQHSRGLGVGRTERAGERVQHEDCRGFEFGCSTGFWRMRRTSDRVSVVIGDRPRSPRRGRIRAQRGSVCAEPRTAPGCGRAPIDDDRRREQVDRTGRRLDRDETGAAMVDQVLHGRDAPLSDARRVEPGAEGGAVHCCDDVLDDPSSRSRWRPGRGCARRAGPT